MPHAMVIKNATLMIRLDPLVRNTRTTDWNQILGFAKPGAITALIGASDAYLLEALNTLQAVRDSLYRLPTGADSDHAREDHMEQIQFLEEEIQAHLDANYSEEAAIEQAESISESSAL